MYLKEIILLVIEFVVSAPDITVGFEIVSTTERGVNRDDRCQQEVIKILGNNLREQQNFWISFYNNSYELQNQKQMQEIGQIFDTKLEEANAEFAKKQEELIEGVNDKLNDLLQHFDKKLEEMEAKFASKRVEIVDKQMQNFDQKVEKEMKEVREEMGKKQKELIEMINNKQNDLLQHFDKKVEEVLKQFKEKIGNITTNIGKVENEETTLPKNCLEILKRGNKVSGVYIIRPKNDSSTFEVWCDMDTRGGGWTYVLNRFDGSQDFYLHWQNYKNGFGNLGGEFWLGLQHLYELTGFQSNHLLVELVDWDNKHYYAMYSVFGIGNEEEGYPINLLDGYIGDAGDSLTYHKNMKFSTHDRDQDESSGNCAIEYHGAWWYNSCYYSNLAGTYFNTTEDSVKGMVWFHLKTNYISLKKVKMMVRP